jgi:peroxiredoxin family protein
MFKKKGIPGLKALIGSADELGVQFIMCQICFDALGLSVDDLIVPHVEVLGATAYVKDTMAAQVNLFI